MLTRHDLLPPEDRLLADAALFRALFHPYDGPDEPLDFDPDDYPVR
jgi:hypothetical protein